MTEGIKHDQDKPRVDLLDPLALEGIAAVLAFGAKKYAAHNWRGGLSYSRLLGAALRHTFALLRGEDVDAESGLPHVDHLGCCWMFLSNMMKTRPDLDDRYKAPVAKPDVPTDKPVVSAQTKKWNDWEEKYHDSILGHQLVAAPRQHVLYPLL